MYNIGLDIGTSSCKSFVYNDEGKPISSAYQDYPLNHPKPGWSEMDPAKVWRAILITLKESIKKSKLNAKDIEAISFSALGHAIMPVGKNAEWLYPTIQVYDQRAVNQILAIQNELGTNKLEMITGRSDVQPPIAYITWVKEKMPKIYNKTVKFVGWHEYALWQLYGEPVVDHSLAACTSAFNVRNGTWSEEILDVAGVDVDLMPRVELAGTKIGEVSSEMSEKTGLAKNTAIVVGAKDTDTAIIASGAIQENIWTDLTGTFELVSATLSHPIKGSRLLCGGINNSQDIPIFLIGIMTSGSVLEWYKETFAQEEQNESNRSGRNTYDLLTEQAASANIGSDKLMLLPDFSGSQESKGALLGLTLRHGKKELVRSILEGLCFELRYVVEKIENHVPPAKEFRVTGGGAKSPFWIQLKSNIVKKRFVRSEVIEGGALGASILAGIGTGAFKNVQQGVNSTYKERDAYSPQTEEAAIYDKYFQLYKGIRPMLVNFYKTLKEI